MCYLYYVNIRCYYIYLCLFGYFLNEDARRMNYVYLCEEYEYMCHTFTDNPYNYRYIKVDDNSRTVKPYVRVIVDVGNAVKVMFWFVIVVQAIVIVLRIFIFIVEITNCIKQ